MGTKTSKSQPISRHPLFPAIVALWFGALFGLSSLAVRVSLIESLVISSHIDAIVPQAAPPLGMTARILLALAMAVIGGLIGGRIGRWIAQPRNQTRERRRGAQPAPTGKPAMTRRQEAVFAPIAETEADADEIGADAGAEADVAAPVATAPAGRRRALAVDESMVRPDYLHDAAPLPGSQPHILDVTKFDFLEADAARQPMSDEPAELDLGAYAAEETDQTVPPPAPLPVEPAPVAQASIEAVAGNAFAMPAIDAVEPHEAEEDASELLELRNNAKQLAIETGPDFDSAPGLQPRPFDAAGASEPVATKAPFAAPATEATAPAFESAAAPARPFAAPAAAGPAADDAVAKPLAAPVEPAAAAKPFAAPAQPEIAAQPFAAPAQSDVAAQPFAAPAQSDVETQPFAAPAQQAAERPFAAEPATIPQAFAPPPETAPAELPRFQPTLPRLGGAEVRFDAEPEAAFAPHLATDLPAEAPVEEPEPIVFIADPQPLPAPLQSLHQTGATPVSRIASADLDELSPVELIERMALSLQRRRARKSTAGSVPEPATGAPMLAAVAAPAPSAEPADPAPPADLPAPEAYTPQAVAPAEPRAPEGLALPAALRPIDFTEYEDDDDSHGFAPARSISMPAPAPEPGADIAPAIPAAPLFAPLSPLDVEADHGMPAEAEVESDDEGIAESSYSSLLDIGRPTEQRQQFIRIEEPEAESDAIEPVVIFPGRSVRAETRFDAPAPAAPEPLPAIPAMEQADGQPQPRRFDTPLAQPGAAPAFAQRDPAETERVLRSALATLQRMSGAA